MLLISTILETNDIVDEPLFIFGEGELQAKSRKKVELTEKESKCLVAEEKKSVPDTPLHND